MRRYFTLLLIVSTAASALPACRPGPMHYLDERADALLVDRETATLGPGQAHDPVRVPQRAVPPHADAASYRTDLASRNPTAKELPIEPAQPGAAPGVSAGAEDASAGDAIELDLQQALGYAIAHSREYRSQKEAVFLSALSLLAEKHLWGPRFFGTFGAAVSGTPESGETDHALELVSEFGVTQRLPYGGEVSARALVNYVNRLRADAFAPRDEQSAALILTLDQPLLRGAGMRAREPLIQAQRELGYAVREFERFRREFFVEVSSAFYDLLQQQQTIVNLERQLTNFEWLHQRIEALAQAGREPFFEVERALGQVLFARNNLINAREAYETQLDGFKIQLGMPVMQRLVILPTVVTVPTPALDREASVLTALKYRLDLQTAEDLIDDARRGVAIARNDLLPDLDLTASLSLPTNSDLRHAGFQLDAGSGSYLAGIEFGVPLDRQVERIRYRQSLVSLERAQRSYTLQRDQVAQQVRRDIRQIDQAQYTLDQQNLNIEIAQKRLRGVVLRLRELGPRDFIEAQDDLLEAQNRRDEAVRNLRVSVLRYLLDSGQLRVNGVGHWLAPGTLTPVEAPMRPANPGEMLQPVQPGELQQDKG